VDGIRWQSPYVMIDEQSNMAELPSWSFDVYPAFQAQYALHRCRPQNAGLQRREGNGQLGPGIAGCLPAADGPDLDLVGFITVSFAEWRNDTAIFCRRQSGAFWAFYHGMNGPRRFALAVLDRTDPAPSGAHLPCRVERALG